MPDATTNASASALETSLLMEPPPGPAGLRPGSSLNGRVDPTGLSYPSSSTPAEVGGGLVVMMERQFLHRHAVAVGEIQPQHVLHPAGLAAAGRGLVLL